MPKKPPDNGWDESWLTRLLDVFMTNDSSRNAWPMIPTDHDVRHGQIGAQGPLIKAWIGAGQIGAQIGAQGPLIKAWIGAGQIGAQIGAQGPLIKAWIGAGQIGAQIGAQGPLIKAWIGARTTTVERANVFCFPTKNHLRVFNNIWGCICLYFPQRTIYSTTHEATFVYISHEEPSIQQAFFYIPHKQPSIQRITTFAYMTQACRYSLSDSIRCARSRSRSRSRTIYFSNITQRKMNNSALIYELMSSSNPIFFCSESESRGSSSKHECIMKFYVHATISLTTLKAFY